MSRIPMARLVRIEVGLQPIRFEELSRLAGILHVPLHEIVKDVAPILKEMVDSGHSLADLPNDPQGWERFEKLGIDVDPAFWSVKLRLRGGAWKVYTISGIEKARLERVMPVHYEAGYVLFDSEDRVVALNMAHVVAWQFVFETMIPLEEATDELSAVQVFLIDQGETLTFEVEADSALLTEDNGEEEGTQLQTALLNLELRGHDEKCICSIEGVDAERAYLKAKEVAIVEMPVWAIYPGVFPPINQSALMTETVQ